MTDWRGPASLLFASTVALAVLTGCDNANFGGASGNTANRSATVAPGSTAGGSTAGGATNGATGEGGGPNGNPGANGANTAGGDGATANGGNNVAIDGNGGNGGNGNTPSTDGANAAGQGKGPSVDGGAVNGAGGSLSSTDGNLCYAPVSTQSPQVSTSSAPLMQMPGGAPIDTSFFNQWEPHSGDNPQPPLKVEDNLQAGDTLSVANITGKVSDGDGSSSCANGDGQNASLKHVLIIQLTDANDKVVDPGVTTVKGLGALMLSQLETTKLTVPAGAVRAYVSVGDTRYSDNHSLCNFTMVLERLAPCAPGQTP